MRALKNRVKRLEANQPKAQKVKWTSVPKSDFHRFTTEVRDVLYDGYDKFEASDIEAMLRGAAYHGVCCVLQQLAGTEDPEVDSAIDTIIAATMKRVQEDQEEERLSA